MKVNLRSPFYLVSRKTAVEFYTANPSVLIIFRAIICTPILQQILRRYKTQ